MAIATPCTEQVEVIREPIFVDKVVGYDLSLSLEEATFLLDVLNAVGGCPWRSRRKFQNSISGALRGAGARDSWQPLKGEIDKSGSIMFADTVPDLST